MPAAFSSLMRFCMLICFLLYYPSLAAWERPTVIVLTDIGGDTDDEQSMVRFLLYADVLDIKGFCVTSRLGHGQDIKPEILHNQIEAYAQVYPNLLLHSPDYPKPEYLMSVVKHGQGDSNNFGEGYDTEASDHIIEVVDQSEQVIHIAVWGGQRELLQALWMVKNSRSEQQYIGFCNKIQVHAIGDQDRHRDRILKEYKEIKFIANGFAWMGFTGIRELSAFRGMYMTGDQSLQKGDWVKTHIHGHGPLSETYQLDGHGTDGMKEGDSPSFLGLIQNGLNVPEKPEWGGWGGRYRHLNHKLYIDAPDFLEGQLNERHSVSRWRSAFQKDFMARLKWCVKPYDEANHNPKVIVNQHTDASPLLLKANAGDVLSLEASKSFDPDGDRLTFQWYFYHEILFNPLLSLKIKQKGKSCVVKIPKEISKGFYHLILEVTDDGSPSLHAYKRIIINVQ
jgi:hypothetical protein